MAPLVRRLLVAGVLFASVCPASRADAPAWPVPVEPAPRPATSRYDAGACAKLPAEYREDAVACVLYSGTTCRLESDGTLEMTTHELIRLNARKGIEEFGEYRNITYATAHERLALHAARIHKAGGGTVEVGPRHLMLRDVNTDHQIYELNKMLVISFPNLEVGDVIEAHWTSRGRHPEHQGQLFQRYSFGHEKYPVVRDEWCVRIPKARTLNHATQHGAVPLTVRDDGDERVYVWATDNRPAPPKGDHLPNAEELRPVVACSTFASWDEVHHWDQNLVRDRSAPTPEIVALAERLTTGPASPQDKARVLAQWVRRNVRYVSSGEKHDYTPHPPARVLADRAGDCKDTALLYTVLARAAGLEAAVATLGSRGDGQIIESLPSPWGSHAIAVVTIDRRDHWVDLTSNGLPWDVLPQDDCDRVCYISAANGLRLARTPPMTADAKHTVHATTIEVRSDGSAHCERTSHYHGVASWTKRDEFAGVPAAERRRLVTAELQDAYAKMRLRDLTFGPSLDDADRPLAIRATFDVPDLFADEGTTAATLGDQGLWGLLLSINIDPERTAALDLGEPFESVQRFVVRLPAAFRFDKLPEEHTIDSPFGRFECKVRRPAGRPRELELEFRTRLAQVRIEPSEFKAFADFQESVQDVYRAAVGIKPTDKLGDAPDLEAFLASHPEDVASAATLAKLYLDNNRQNDAARILSEAKARQPAQRKLWALHLLAIADDPDASETLLRAMRDQFPGDTDVVLDLGNLLVEQSKYDEATQILTPLTGHAQASVQRQAHLGLAALRLLQEDVKQAQRHIKAAETADSAGFDAADWTLTGQVREALRQPKPALEAYRKALEHQPEGQELFGALAAIARLAGTTGARAEALDALARLRHEARDDADGLALAADVAARLGRFDEAIELAQRAGAGPDGLPVEAHRALGLALSQRGDFEQAVKHLSEADDDADVLAARMLALLALGRLEEAERTAGQQPIDDETPHWRTAAADVKRLVRERDAYRRQRANPEAAELTALERTLCAARLHERRQWPGRVASLLDAALGDAPRFGPALGLRAVLHAEAGRLQKALADAEQAIALAPDDARGNFARGWVRRERGVEGAVADLERAAELTRRQDGAVLHHLAAALSDAGRRDDARAAQREAAKLRPDDKEVQDQLKELSARP